MATKYLKLSGFISSCILKNNRNEKPLKHQKVETNDLHPKTTFKMEIPSVHINATRMYIFLYW